MADGLDQDCDGRDALTRSLLLSDFVSPGWEATGSATLDGDVVTVGGQDAGSASRGFNKPLPTGKVLVALGVTEKTGPLACTAFVETQPWGGGTPIGVAVPIASTGELISEPLPVHSAPRILGQITLSCPAGSRAVVDWVSVQNSGVVVPPADDITIHWRDVEAPGGGSVQTIARAERVWGMSEGVSRWMPTTLVYASGDNSGISVRDASGWRTINGSVPGASLDEQAKLAVWDILPTGDEIYILTGRRTTDYIGYLMRSTNQGETWEVLADSEAEQVGGQRLIDPTTGGYAKNYAGGRLIVEDPRDTTIYFANGDPDEAVGRVWIIDAADSVCRMDTLQLPSTGWLRALEWTTSASGLPVLLVGYGLRDASEPSLYACQLDDTPVDCSVGSPVPVCWPVGGSEGMDLRDLEVFPKEPSEYVVADATTGLVWGGTLEDDGAELISQELWENEISRPLVGAESIVTGLAFDVAGDYLFEFIPMPGSAQYHFDRITRIDVDDVHDTGATTAWEGVNTDDTGGDEAERLSHVDGLGAWLVGPGAPDQIGLATSWPARYAPGPVVDGVWVPMGAGPEWPYGTLAFLAGYTFMWEVSGLEEPPDAGYAWDPEGTTDWTFAPNPDETEDRTWQSTTVSDIAVDSEGRLWMAEMDQGMRLRPPPTTGAPEPYSQLDCLWRGYATGGVGLSVGLDQSVWLATAQQGDNGIPQDFGVFRTSIEYGVGTIGEIWEYEGAGFTTVPSMTQRRKLPDETYVAICNHERVVGDRPVNVAPMGTSSGMAFNDGLADTTNPSWGNPKDIRALDRYTAVVSFTSYTDDGTGIPGRFGYTVDGGSNWHEVPFDGDWDEDAGTTDDCDNWGFFVGDRLGAFALVDRGFLTVVGEDSWTEGRLVGGDRIVLYATSHEQDVDADHCGLARVVITADGPDADADDDVDWEWVALPSSDADACRVHDHSIIGVVGNPWLVTSPFFDEFFVWGKWRAGRKYGGVCSVRRTLAGSYTFTSVLDPRWNPATGDFYPSDIGDVAPHPSIDGLLLIGQSGSLGSQAVYHDEFGTLDRPTGWPLIAEWSGSAWRITPLDDEVLPNFAVTSAEWGTYESPHPDPGEYIFLGTAGSGTWHARYSEAP